MVDRDARNKMAELLRHFAAGLLTNDEFCDSLPRSNYDCSVNYFDDLAQFEFEGLYCKPYRIDSRKLTREGQLQYARWVLFLQTDLDYENYRSHTCYCISFLGSMGVGILCFSNACSTAAWLASYISAFAAAMIANCLIPVLAFISTGYILGWLTKRIFNISRSEKGDESVWPFFRRSDYEEALKHPKLLCSKMQ